jgi:hypothetical protein
MTTISLPLWMIITAVGLPSIGLVWVFGSLLKRKRALRKEVSENHLFSPFVEYRQPLNSFQQNLINQQIDAVFNGLVALIETERFKLKSMLRINGNAGIVDASYAGLHCQPNDPNDRQDRQSKNINQSINNKIVAKESDDEIAVHSELSQAELDLVKTMQQASGAPKFSPGSKLTAVA